MTDFRTIAALLENGRMGRDRDADIYEALGYRVKRVPEGRSSMYWRYFEPDGSRWLSLSHLTTSLDECSRFIEARHPAWAWTVSNIGPSDEPHALITLDDEPCTDIEGSAWRSSVALAIALCIAEATVRGQ